MELELEVGILLGRIGVFNDLTRVGRGAYAMPDPTAIEQSHMVSS